MKKLSTRFFLSCAITSIVLITSIPMLRETNDILWNGTSYFNGFLISFAFIAGLIGSTLKSRQVGQSSSRSMHGGEKFMVVVLYIFAILSYVLMLNAALGAFFGGIKNIPDWATNLGIALMLVSFGFLIAEIYFLISRSTKTQSARTKRISGILLQFYISIGSALAWDVFILGGQMRIREGHLISETIALVILALMVLLPFQRLQWVELFSESKTAKDNWIVFGGFCAVILSAIVPVYFL